MNGLATLFLFILTVMNGYNLVNQKNQRDDLKELAKKLEMWIGEFIELKTEHKHNHAHKHHDPDSE